MGKSSHFSGQPLYCQVIKLNTSPTAISLDRKKHITSLTTMLTLTATMLNMRKVM